MLEFEQPKIKDFDQSETYAKFVIEPLERGYGTTLGNSLRRVLLSSLPGAAITSINIEGVQHEFATIPGVREDVVQLILAIKGVAIKSYVDDEKTIELDATGPATVTAGDILTDSDLEIINKDHYLFTIAKGHDFHMTMTVGTGRGYVPADENKSDNASIGTIAVDALYSPVTKVNYQVEPARVGDKANYDKLTLEIATNGTTTPADALSLSSKVLTDHLAIFTELTGAGTTETSMVSGEEVKPERVLERMIETMDFSVRCYNGLKRAGFNTVADIVNQPEPELIKIKNLGKKSIDEVKAKLETYGIELHKK